MKKRVALCSLMWEEQHVNHIKWGCVTVVSSKSGEKINVTFPDFDVMIFLFKWWDLKVHSKQDHKNNIISSEPKGLKVESNGSEKWKQGQGRLCCGQLWLRVHHRGGQGGNFPSNFFSLLFWLFSSHLAQVWMKEGEVLLLLSKTNGDWWQVCLKRSYKYFSG